MEVINADGSGWSICPCMQRLHTIQLANAAIIETGLLWGEIIGDMYIASSDFEYMI